MYIFQILKYGISELDPIFDTAKASFNEAYDLYWTKHQKYREWKKSCRGPFETTIGIWLMLNSFLNFVDVTGDEQYETNIKKEIIRQLNRMSPPVQQFTELTPSKKGGRMWNSTFKKTINENDFEIWQRSTKTINPIPIIIN